MADSLSGRVSYYVLGVFFRGICFLLGHHFLGVGGTPPKTEEQTPRAPYVILWRPPSVKGRPVRQMGLPSGLHGRER